MSNLKVFFKLFFAEMKNIFKKAFIKTDKGLTILTRKESAKTIITSLWCAFLGIFIGFIILLILNPSTAVQGITTTLKNFFTFSDGQSQLQYFGTTLTKTAPLIIVSLSILFGYKCGLFNIGASGQYTIAYVVILYAGIAGNLNWFIVLILAILAGALYGVITGLLKAFFNVNEVISGIMLNWIALYFANGILQANKTVWDTSHAQSFKINPGSAAFLPNIGLDKVFAGNSLVGLGIIITIVVVLLIFFILKKTTFGYEIQAIGFNKDASQYAGMSKKKSTIITTAICGGLAGLAASLSTQNGFSSWWLYSVVDPIGFNGISAAFLGGLNPIGVIFSSYFITHITEGGSLITDLGFAPQVADIMVASIIYLSGFVAFFKKFVSDKDLIKDMKLPTRKSKRKEKK